MLKKITIDQIRSWNPCYDPVEKGVLPENWEGTILDILALDISVSDKLWAALREEVFSAEQCEAYKEAEAPLVKAYDEAHVQLVKAYREADAPLVKAYDEARAPLVKAYDEARAPLVKAYDEAHVQLLKAYEGKCLAKLIEVIK